MELTHANILANIRQALAITDFVDQDRLFNALPMFHSFGLAVGTLLGTGIARPAPDARGDRDARRPCPHSVCSQLV